MDIRIGTRRRVWAAAFALGSVALCGSVEAATGDLDAGFGAGGVVVTGPGVISSDAWANAIGIQPLDQKIVLVGTTTTTTGSNWLVARYLADGTLDATFGGGAGYVRLALGSPGTGGAIGVGFHANGRIVVAGTLWRSTGKNNGHHDLAVARLLSDGTVDTSFGVAGVAYANLVSSNSDDSAVDAVVMTDGRIIVGGYATAGKGTFPGLARFTASGALDGTFGSGGKVTFASSSGWSNQIRRLDVDSNGRILTISREAGAYVLHRYTPGGAVDTSFATTSLSASYAGSAWNGVRVDGAGRVLVSGAWQSQAVIARYDSTGALDGGYGTAGVAYSGAVSGAGLSSSGRKVAFQLDGKAVLAGELFQNGTRIGIQVYRFDTQGTLDSSFGSAGVSQLAGPPGSFASLLPVEPAVDSLGGILVCGNASPSINGQPRSPAMVRFVP